MCKIYTISEVNKLFENSDTITCENGQRFIMVPRWLDEFRCIIDIVSAK